MTFLDSLPPYGPARERAVADAIAAGRIDPPTWTEVRCGAVTLTVSSDYLTIDGTRIPMSTANAQAAVDSLGALLPTPAIVVAIEEAAREEGRIVPFVPWPRWQDDSQLWASTIAWRERNIPQGAGLVAGHLKDVVLAAAMPPGRVVIFGALYASGLRVQPVYAGHEATFDGGYAHGVRAVRDDCMVDGHPARVSEILSGPSAILLGGPVAALRYDTFATAPTDRPEAPDGRPTDPAPRVLRRGDRGEDVAELQRLLTAAGWYTRADGAFGPLTEAAVRTYQGEAGLTQDGLAGSRTLAALRAHRPADAMPEVPPALSEAAVDALFGPLQWVAAPTAAEPGAIKITNAWQENLRRVVIPQIRGIDGAPASGAVYLHRLVVDQTLALWAAWEAAGLLPLVRTWAGSWNPRLVRGGSTLSRHAYAVGWDVNAAWNPMGRAPAPRGAPGSVVDLVPLAVAHGYTWGGTWSRPDGMHFEAVKAS